MRKNIALLIVFLLGNASLIAQQDSLQLRIEGDDVHVRILKDMDITALDSLLCSYGTCMSEMDSLWKSNGKTTHFGWKLDQFVGEWIELHKPVHSLKGSFGSDNIIVLDPKASSRRSSQSKFGVNNFKYRTIEELPNGKSRFICNAPKAHSVYLSGTFNSWSTLQTPMQLENGLYFVDIELGPGKYEYKFIIDGKWENDHGNRQRVQNEHGTDNSVYFKPNVIFQLNDFYTAKKVVLAGSFNDWNESEIRMSETKTGWAAELFLPEGTYTYKFIVDGEWMTDPQNPTTIDDGFGNINSVFTMGTTTPFTLEGFPNANKVVLSGSFNNWDEKALNMTKTTRGWETSIALSPGMYEYKFIVDGVWTLDPANPIQNGQGDFINSVHIEEPNKHFVLNGFTEAKSVICTGTFNGWSESGYQMNRIDDVWELALFLDPGKYAYKFIVDGKWIIDPANPYFEHNEFDDFNSIVWIE